MRACVAARLSREALIRCLPGERARVVVLAIALGGTLQSAGAAAQVSGTLTVVSDYRFRGVSLSAQKPAVQGALAYDDPQGWYLGAFGSTVELAGGSSTTAQLLAYAGVTRPAGGAFHWDLGAYYSAFTQSRSYDYGELYLGITSSDFTARVHYSPKYFGAARGSFYGEIDVARPLGGGFVLFGHVGVLVPDGHGEYQYGASVQNPVDARAGLGFEIGGLKLQLAWVGINGVGSVYPVYDTQRRNTLVGSATWSF
jgi:uncharacterized protein (TIGR02001 family)